MLCSYPNEGISNALLEEVSDIDSDMALAPQKVVPVNKDILDVTGEICLLTFTPQEEGQFNGCDYRPKIRNSNDYNKIRQQERKNQSNCEIGWCQAGSWRLNPIDIYLVDDIINLNRITY